jgi:diguanylate cyclase (GGDEF)-like protein
LFSLRNAFAMRILVVEDDELTAHSLLAILTAHNYAVETATDGEAGLNLVSAFDYDLVLSDVMLPKLDGISLCRKIRSQGLQMPILLLTGCDSGHDKAIGLDAGADDYVVKPFDEEELIARVRALLRRGSTVSQPILEWGDLQLDPGSCEVTYGAKPLVLTPKEYALLELFLRNSRRVFSCGMILEHLWAYEETPGEDAVRTHIKGLRQKLKAAGVPGHVIETVYGIGYRLKPEQENSGKTFQASSKGAVSQPTRQQTLTLVNKVWHRFKARVSEQVGVLEKAVMALRCQELNQELLQQAIREAHTLAGSLGTFGLQEGSRLARQIEKVFRAEHPLSQGEAVDLREWVTALRQEFEQSSQASTAIAALDDRPLLLVVDGDRSLAEPLVTEATSGGFRTEIVTSLAEARDKLYLQSPNVVILDPAVSTTLAESLSLLVELSKQVPPVPVVIYTAHDELTERREFAHSGGRIFLQKPASPVQVLEAVTQVLQHADQVKARVMIVDDDPNLLMVVRSLLEPWGLKVTTLADPQQFWSTLEVTSPDLLILDVEMPHLSGLDLCQIVRNDSCWSSLPILFLTAHTDFDTVNQVFAVGADDFVSKPIVGPELVTRIINRLERVQLLRNLAETDPLTKVANRQKSTQDLDKFLHLAQRQTQSFCLAVLDLDCFKQVNDRYGHATGDEVLRQVGRLLQRSFRKEDVVARWGGEEFVIGLYGINRDDGVQRLNKLLKMLHQQTFTALNLPNSPQPTHEFQVAFSAGVAQFPEDGVDLHTLYQAADRALYQAKAAGRDRVLPAEAL